VKAGAERVVEHVGEGVLEVVFSVEHPRVETPLEEVPNSVIAPVEARRVQAVEAVHPARELRLGRPDDDVQVIRHQRPGEYLPAEALRYLAQLPFPAVAIERVEDDGALGNATGRDRVDRGSRKIGTPSSGHLGRR
jgi:hypothetical protein